MKMFYIISAFIALFFIGFIIPSYIVTSSTPGLVLYEGQMQAMEPFGILFMVSKIIPNKNNEYQNRCRGLEQVLMQTYTWMMIPGPVIEACVYNRDKHGEIENLKSAGMIKKGVVYPKF